MKLRNVLFWDTDPALVDPDVHVAYVIERVARFGILREWKQLLAYYGEERIKKEVIKLRDLDIKTLNFLSVRFKIPKEEFRCYTNQRFQQTHYPY